MAPAGDPLTGTATQGQTAPVARGPAIAVSWQARAAGWDSELVRFQHTVVISCVPEVVFSWIENPDRARQWQPDVAGGEVVHAEPGLVGTEFREILQGNRGRVEMRGRITEFQPGTAMAVLLEGQGMTVTARYQVSPHPRGTLLRAEQSLTLPGRAAKLLQPLIRRRVAARARADLQRLKHLCESDASGPK
jgi:uncharacterized protein YndB with AHSA1/START domain